MVELIRGRVCKMYPAPITQHQLISTNLARLIANSLYKKPCRVFAAPFVVRLPLPDTKTIDTVVQPDLTIVYDAEKLDEKGCHGSPDSIIEILSKSTAKKDQ